MAIKVSLGSNLHISSFIMYKGHIVVLCTTTLLLYIPYVLKMNLLPILCGRVYKKGVILSRRRDLFRASVALVRIFVRYLSFFIVYAAMLCYSRRVAS